MKKKEKNIFIRNLVIVLILIVGMAISYKPLLNNLNFGLDLQGGFEVLYKVNSIDGEKITNDMVRNTYKTIGRRIDVLGVSEPSITIEGKDKIRVQLAGVTDQETARKLLSKAANLTFRDTNNNLLMTSSVLKSGGAKKSQDSKGNPAVALSISDKDKFYEITKKVSESEDKRIVIWLDYEEGDDFKKEVCGSTNSKCLSAAYVKEAFSDDVIIQGNFKTEEVKNLVELINSGSLPTKLEEISSKTVKASFGEKALNQTLIAGIVGITLIILFMIFVYHFAGFISGISILIYTFITFLMFWLIGGVLTLPGIAAVVIGIGMAVDASVISFSRIKDELRNGNKLSKAFELGNSNSFMTILDSNITTMLVAVVLFIFGESSIKGFATMLIISIIVTLIVMVFVSRWLLKIFVKTDYFKNKENLFIGYKKEIKTRNFNFVQTRKWFYIGSIMMVVLGLISLSLSGLKLGIDFKGGSSITISSNQEIKEEQILNDIEKLEFTLVEVDVIDEKTIAFKIEETLDEEKVIATDKYFNELYEATTDIGVVSNIVKKELVKNAIISLILASLVIVIYISIRFAFGYSIPAILSLLHDVFFIIALFSLLKLEVSSIFIAAILSIIGYSINDTIVTFDRIRENIKRDTKNEVKNKEQLIKIVNDSLNQTINRSLITTITTLIPVIILIILGSHEIINFNIALLFGLISGVYSSIFIASQLWYDFTKKNIGKIKKDEEDDEIEELKIKGINY